MMADTDFKKLLEQEPDFKLYAQDALMGAFANTMMGKQMLQMLHTFYQIGMEEDKVREFLTQMFRQNGGE